LNNFNNKKNEQTKAFIYFEEINHFEQHLENYEDLQENHKSESLNTNIIGIHLRVGSWDQTTQGTIAQSHNREQGKSKED
jgi:hypothetical protein